MISGAVMAAACHLSGLPQNFRSCSKANLSVTMSTLLRSKSGEHILRDRNSTSMFEARTFSSIASSSVLSWRSRGSVNFSKILSRRRSGGCPGTWITGFPPVLLLLWL